MQHPEIFQPPLHISHGTYSADIPEGICGFSVLCSRYGTGNLAEEISVCFRNGNSVVSCSDFGTLYWEYPDYTELARNTTEIRFMLKDGPDTLPEAVVSIVLTRDNIRFSALPASSDFVPLFSGYACLGGSDAVPVCLDRKGFDLRSAYGPAASAIDDALFCRKTDTALRIGGADGRHLRYDYLRKQYRITGSPILTLSVEDHVIGSRFTLPYKPMNRNTVFPTPPAGWMSWYAVGFDGCEDIVLANTRKQKELFADYGVNTIWVDWEWMHSAFHDENPDSEIHYFAPDPIRYPRGLAPVAEEIKKEGFAPVLWVGPTVEPAMAGYMAEHPETMLTEHLSWCGRFYYDVTNTRFLTEYIPKVFRHVKELGFEALKWDCLPSTMDHIDRCHRLLEDSSVNTEDAMRRMVEIARKTVGEDFYMLSCSGGDRTVLFASDLFDAARIGGDISTWEDFLKEFIGQIPEYYPLHGNLFFCDPDNVVLRPEYNTVHQAMTRVSLVSLLGLPVTFGDDLRNLPADRIDMLRRALPPLDIAPKDLRYIPNVPKQDTIVANLTVSKPFGEWNVVQIANLKQEVQTVSLHFGNDLHLDDGEYLVYDYWNRTYIGKFTDSITLQLPACGSAVLSLRSFTGKMQIISTSRHISQGAFDLLDLQEENSRLKGRSLVVAGEPYVITYYDPETDFAKTHTLIPEKTGEIEWVI